MVFGFAGALEMQLGEGEAKRQKTSFSPESFQPMLQGYRKVGIEIGCFVSAVLVCIVV
jgi:hypothetical protein